MSDPGAVSESEFDVKSLNINSRHSTRRFLSDPIPEEDLKGILDAGLLAPSSKNRQPWKLLVLRDEKVLKLSESMSTRIYAEITNTDDPDLEGDLRMALKTMEIIRNVPVLLVVGYIDRKPYHNVKPMRAGMTDRQLMDIISIGAFVENIILEASERGVGSLWIGDYLYAYDSLTDVLKPEFDIVSMVALGFPDEEGWSRTKRSGDRIEYL